MNECCLLSVEDLRGCLRWNNIRNMSYFWDVSVCISLTRNPLHCLILFKDRFVNNSLTKHEEPERCSVSDMRKAYLMIYGYAAY